MENDSNTIRLFEQGKILLNNEVYEFKVFVTDGNELTRIIAAQWPDGRIYELIYNPYQKPFRPSLGSVLPFTNACFVLIESSFVHEKVIDIYSQ